VYYNGDYSDNYRYSGIQPTRSNGDRYSGYGNTGSEDYGYSGSSQSSTGYSSNYAKRFLTNNKPQVNKGTSASKYKSGVKVKHVKFGEGTVITTRGEGDNMIVDVAFKGVGIKALAVKYAPLEIL
jgi:DNA helicase-2/ATP-dependent DNA helicase PcrA